MAVVAALLAAAPASAVTAQRLGVVPEADAIGDAGGGQIWVRVATGKLHRFDPRKGRYVRSCRIPPGRDPPVPAGGGAVWTKGGGAVTRTDRRCHQVSHKFGGQIWDMAGGPDGSVWVLRTTRDPDPDGFGGDLQRVDRVSPSGASRAVVILAHQPPDMSDPFDNIDSIAVGSDGALWMSAIDDDSGPGEDEDRSFNVLVRVGKDGTTTVEERSDGLRVTRFDLLPAPGRRFFLTERVQDGPDIDDSPRHTQVARFRPGRGFDAPYGRGVGSQGNPFVDGAGRPWIGVLVRRTRGSKARGFALIRLDGGKRRTRVVPREKRWLEGPMLTTVVGGHVAFAVPSPSGRYAMALYRVR